MKVVKLILILLLTTSCFSCITYQVGKLSYDVYKTAKKTENNLNQEYEEAKKSRPNLTFQEFLNERVEATRQKEYQEALKTRPDLTYEQFLKERTPIKK